MGALGLTERVCIPELPWLSFLNFPGCKDLWIWFITRRGAEIQQCPALSRALEAPELRGPL